MSTPHEILRHQVRIVPALQYIASFRHVGSPRTALAALPITDAEVAAWVARHAFVRSAMKPEHVRALAYLETRFGQHVRVRAQQTELSA